LDLTDVSLAKSQSVLWNKYVAMHEKRQCKQKNGIVDEENGAHDLNVHLARETLEYSFKNNRVTITQIAIEK
jgi:hypothetical protein